MRDKSKFILTGGIMLFSIILIFIPWLTGNIVEFKPDNYYSIVAALIGGSITLFTLSWQFWTESEKRRNERIVLVRGYFKFYYLPYTQNQTSKLKSFLFTNLKGVSEIHEPIFLIAIYHSHDIAYETKLKFKNNENILGMIVPEQIFAFKLDKNIEDFEISLEFTTVMKEKITHSLKFTDDLTGQFTERYKPEKDDGWKTSGRLFLLNI